jgi:hypothetical protein
MAVHKERDELKRQLVELEEKVCGHLKELDYVA